MKFSGTRSDQRFCHASIEWGFGGAWMDRSPMLCGKKGADRFLVLSATALFTHGDLIFKTRFFRKTV